jgi:hypothetical protein
MISKRLNILVATTGRLLSYEDIDELNQKLENLFMCKGEEGSNEEQSKPKEKEEETKDEHEQQYHVSKKKDQITSY